MDRRNISIVKRVQRQPGIRMAELAAEFDVSERTMRTYLQNINRELEGIADIQSSRSKGVRLIVQDDDALAGALQASAVVGGGAIPVTPEERVSYLVNDLLTRTDWITLDELASIIYVSSRTLSDDLKRVEQVLGKFDLSIERRPRYGLRVTGSEVNRRLCLAGLVMSELAEGDGADAGFDVKTISACVDDVVRAENFTVNSVAYQNLIIHIAIAVERIRENCYVPMETERLERLRSTHEYEIAGKIAERIGAAFQIELPEEEVAYIAIHLSAKQSLQPFDGSGDDEMAGLVISDEVWAVVDEMLELVRQSFAFDLRGDLELRMNLARHIVPLATRLQFSLNLDNPLLSDIKTRFPLAYSMAVDASTVLTRHYDAVPSEDEVGYIALAFALALERRKAEAPKKNILVVCASGAGSAKLMEYRYRREFGNCVDQVTACDVSHIDEVDFSTIDYVFTTVPLNRAVPVPVREVGLFLEGTDVAEVRAALDATPGAGDAYEGLFSPALFFPHAPCASKEEVLELLCAAAHELEGVPAEFDELVRERERLAQTAFGNLVAMPHPMEPVSERTFVAVCLLDEPVMWSGRDVRAVFLVSIARERDRDLNAFFDRFSQMLLSKEAIARLLEEQTFEVLLEEFRRFTDG